MTTITTADRLKDNFSGEVVRPDDTDNESLRRVFNGMIDRRPVVIARCATAADVVAAVNFGREHELPIAVHEGGHDVAGHAVGDGALMIDLRPMKEIRVDAGRSIARAQAGLTCGELDTETAAHGLAVTGGRASSTGIAGLTAGSGSGWLERKLGLTADNLLSAEVALADGSLVNASDEDNGDLFWALRGGGGSVGIVTKFEFRLHAVGPIVLGGIRIHGARRTGQIVRFFRDFMANAPDEVGAGVALDDGPARAVCASALFGKPAVGIIVCYAGEVTEGERVLAPLREYGPPNQNHRPT